MKTHLLRHRTRFAKESKKHNAFSNSTWEDCKNLRDQYYTNLGILHNIQTEFADWTGDFYEISHILALHKLYQF